MSAASHTTTDQHADTIRQALDTLYHFTHDAAKAVGAGRSETHSAGVSALAALRVRAAAADQLADALRDLLDDGGVDDIDPRLDYVMVQSSRDVLARAMRVREAYDAATETGT